MSLPNAKKSNTARRISNIYSSNWFTSTMRFSIFICIILVLGAACSGNDDTPPSLEVPTINFQSENIVVEAPSELRFDGLFSDDDATDSLELRIMPISTSATPGFVTSRSPFLFAEKTEMGGKRTAITRFITLPESAAEGNYELIAGFQDNSGNVADSVRLPFQLFNVAPYLELSVNTDTAIIVSPSDSLALIGKVSYASSQLERVQFQISGKGNYNVRTFSRTDSTLSSNTLLFDFKFGFPTTADTGTYAIEITATDTAQVPSSLVVPVILQ